MLSNLFSLVFYFCFWGAVLGFYFIGIGAKTGDTDLIIFGLPYALLGTLLAIITFKITKSLEG